MLKGFWTRTGLWAAARFIINSTFARAHTTPHRGAVDGTFVGSYVDNLETELDKVSPQRVLNFGETILNIRTVYLKETHFFNRITRFYFSCHVLCLITPQYSNFCAPMEQRVCLSSSDLNISLNTFCLCVCELFVYCLKTV